MIDTEVKLRRFFSSLDITTEVVLVLGAGWPDSCYKAFVKRKSRWYKVETGVMQVEYDSVKRYTEGMQSLTVRGRMRSAVLFGHNPRNLGLRLLHERAVELYGDPGARVKLVAPDDAEMRDGGPARNRVCDMSDKERTK